MNNTIREQVLTDIESRLITSSEEIKGQTIRAISAYRTCLFMIFESGKFAAYSYETSEYDFKDELDLITWRGDLWRYLKFLVRSGVLPEENEKIALNALKEESRIEKENAEKAMLKRLKAKYE